MKRSAASQGKICGLRLTERQFSKWVNDQKQKFKLTHFDHPHYYRAKLSNDCRSRNRKGEVSSMRLYVSTVLVAMFLLTIPALAHHSFTSFWYTDRTVEITGIVKTVKLVNPHANMTVEVTEANGEKSLWSITSKGSVSALRQA